MNEGAPHTANGPAAEVSSAQRRLWFLEQLARGGSDNLLPLALRVRGALDVPALERALAGVVTRHEVLRTRFTAVDGEPVPVLDPPDAVVLRHLDAASPQEVFERELRRPLDLAVEPPVRAVLARLGAEDHLLLLVVHHIAVDGWSWDVLLRELAAGYRGEHVPAPAHQYADFAAWQNARRTPERLARLLAHWTGRLTGVTPLALPTDRPRPEVWDGSGDVVRFVVPPDLLARVDAAARERRATRYQVLLAVYQSLLGHHSGRTDVATCTTMTDRGGPLDTANLIGPFVNTVVLRTDLGGRPSFDALLRRVRDGVLKDLSHAEAPFDRVVGALGLERDLSRHPLAQASFTLLNTAHQGASLQGLDAELVRTPLDGTDMEVFLDLTLMPDGSLLARLQYATALFDRATAEQLADGFLALLTAVLDDPDAPVADLAALLPPLPGRVLLDTWGRPAAVQVPEPLRVRGSGERAALVCGADTVTYDRLEALTGGLAALLREAGVRRGDAVGVCLPRGTWSVVAMLAIWRAGGVHVPLDAALPVERRAFMVAEAGVRHAVGDTGVAGVRHLDVADVDPDAGVDPVDPDPAELAYVIFTSGSTGLPKAVGVEHGALAAHVTAARDRYAVTEADRVLAFSSFSFDASLDQLLPALTRGATVVLRGDEPWLPASVPALVAAHGLTVLNLPPTYWSELALSLASGPVDSSTDLAGLRLLILGGEEVPTGALAAWRGHAPHVRVLNAYGPTEAVVTATTHEVAGAQSGGAQSGAAQSGGAQSGRVPIGRPLGGRRVLVVDAGGDPVGVGEPGELLVGGAELARGYLGRPALTAERFVPDPAGGRLYRTGDLVRWRADGELEFLGRADDQVKIRGYRVELGEVESALSGCAGVLAAAAAVKADAHGGQSLVGYVVPAGAPTAATPTAAELRAELARALPHYAVPAEIVVLDALPVTTSGKLDRAALPDPDRSAAPAGDHAEPRDDVEREIARIWAEVLGVPRVGLDDGFFDLGGHSLLATMAVSRVAERLGRDVELRVLFENPRIREFGPLVAAARPVATARVVPVDRSGPLPMSFAQERLWFLDRVSDSGEDYVLWFSWRVGGPLDADAWEAALGDVVARHEVLRTALIEVDGHPVQLVRHDVPVPLERRAGHDVEQVRREAKEFAAARFELDRPPLVRSGLWRLGPDEHVLVLAFHHVATDGWSKDVVIGDLARCYTARVAGRTPELPALPVQYGDYAVWQRDLLDSGALDGQLAHWSAALDGVAALDLPTDHPRPATRSARGGAVETPLPPELAEGVDALAHRFGTTRFTVLLAVLQSVLARWSGQTDVAVGTPVAGRGRVELEGLVGFFVNTVVLRGDLSGDPTFAELITRARDTALTAFGNQDVPFERLVERLRPERDLSRNPLFQVMFDVQESAVSTGLSLPGLDLTGFALPWESAKFDLTATFLAHPDRFSLDVEYSADLFDAATATRLAEHVVRALRAAIADPDSVAARADLLSPGEHAALTAPPPPAPAAPLRLGGVPEATALVCGERAVTYGELDGLVGGLASALVAGGVRRGDPVGVCLSRGPWSVAAMLAVWRAGGAYVPLDPALPEERLRYALAEAGARVAVVDERTSGPLTRLGAQVVPVGSTTPGAHPAADPDPADPDPTDLAYVIFTSGSTGRPKAVGVDHGPLAAHVAAARELYALTPDDRVLSFASLSFDASLEQLLPALAAGATVVLRPDEVWSVDELAAEVRGRGVTVAELTPSYWAQVVARLGDLAPDLAGLRLLVTGGEALPAEPLGRWFELLPHVPVVNSYGPTEAVIAATAHLVTGPVAGRVPIGTALGARTLHVVDRHDRPVPDGVPGELLIGGPHLARGYLGHPELTAERFPANPFGPGRAYRTGDRVRRLPGGELEFLGRVDDQVKIRGHRIEPGEAAAVLRECPGVRGAAVVVRDVGGEPALVGYATGEGLDPGGLTTWCRDRLPGYLVPTAVVLLDALPLTVQGKLDTAALPDPTTTAPGEHVPPGTPTEVVLAQIWAEVLGVDRVGLHDDFFALGGHSLRAVATASRVRTAFDCPLAVRELFDNPTVALLAAEVERLLVEQISAMSEDEIDLSLSVDAAF
ncbi:non-ribosomal peptide synthetase [Actinosynnema mirum]|uniref:Amino acid adenylation domain protein n=1 Tax=Actinosynnema mirum (strain ATCC 29888 / DSM 43827 / JCM 3225 / NBRC 14064 / NCIMB 13271 / NRRL B-12336 / IMRU 3971 / 101) TaxID=446462 RepID=C6WAZ9_ACTMD|nr:non-ribosomal peptide synthetase [Actinosynnema mirum]ACU37468.1 amino acid adenylation domain protein [Actinosynnema mirum DSM 43827]